MTGNTYRNSVKIPTLLSYQGGVSGSVMGARNDGQEGDLGVFFCKHVAVPAGQSI